MRSGTGKLSADVSLKPSKKGVEVVGKRCCDAASEQGH